MLTKNDQASLKWACQMAVMSQAPVVTENAEMFKFVQEELTYEQLLNLCFNPSRDEVYMESEVLEDTAKQMILEISNGETKSKFEVLEEALLTERVEIADKAKRLAGDAKKIAGDAKETALRPAKALAAELQGAGGIGPQKKFSVAGVARSVGKGLAAAPGKATVGAALAVSAAGYYIYRKLRRAGASKSEAAAAAAQASRNAGNAAEAKRWNEKAKRWSK